MKKKIVSNFTIYTLVYKNIQKTVVVFEECIVWYVTYNLWSFQSELKAFSGKCIKYVQFYLFSNSFLNVISNFWEKASFWIDAFNRDATIALTIWRSARNFPRFPRYIASNSCSRSRLIKRLPWSIIYSNTKVRPMRGLVGYTILIIAKTAVIASLLKLPYDDLTCSFANTRLRWCGVENLA